MHLQLINSFWDTNKMYQLSSPILFQLWNENLRQMSNEQIIQSLEKEMWMPKISSFLNLKGLHCLLFPLLF